MADQEVLAKRAGWIRDLARGPGFSRRRVSDFVSDVLLAAFGCSAERELFDLINTAQQVLEPSPAVRAIRNALGIDPSSGAIIHGNRGSLGDRRADYLASMKNPVTERTLIRQEQQGATAIAEQSVILQRAGATTASLSDRLLRMEEKFQQVSRELAHIQLIIKNSEMLTDISNQIRASEERWDSVLRKTEEESGG